MKFNLNIKNMMFFLLVIFFYTFIILGIVIRNELKSNKTNGDNQDKIYLENTSAKIDQQIQFSLKSIALLMTKESTKSFAEESDISYSLFAQIYDDIYDNDLFSNQTPYSIGLLNPQNNFVVSSDGYFLKNDFLKYIGFSKTDDIHQSFNQSNFSYMIFTNKNNITLLKKEEINSKYVFFFFYWDNINSELQSKKKISIQNNTSQQLDTNISTEIQSFTDNNKQYFVKTSEILPLISYRVNTYRHFSISYSLVSSLFLPFILLFILGMLFLLIVNNNFYKPYTKILKLVKDSSTRVSIHTPITEQLLQEVLDKDLNFNALDVLIQEELTDLFIQRYFNTEQLNEHLLEQLPLLNLEQINESGSLIYLTFAGMNTQEKEFSAKEIIQIRRHIIKQFTNQHSLEVISLSISAFILLSFDNKNDFLTTNLDKLKKDFQTNLQLDINFIFSKSFSNIEEFSKIFSNMNEWIQPNLTQKDTDNILLLNFNHSNSTLHPYSVNEEQLLIQYIKVNDFTKAEIFFEGILDDMFRNATYGVDITNIISTYTLTIRRILSSNEENAFLFFKTHTTFFNNPNAVYFKESTQNDFLLVFNSLLDILSKEKKESSTDKIIHFINNNYIKDLSLTDIANEFSLTEPYISKLIKEHLNIPFKTYLNQLRIETSKKLLIDSREIILDISEQVGFKNVNSYIRVFKQFEGITPGNYRKQYYERQSKK